MRQTINVYALPDLVPEDDYANTAVCIDVLRATSTIAKALENGASGVLTFSKTEDVLKRKEQISRRHPEQLILLGGERQGVRIDGFDLGNSPCEYTPAQVSEKLLLFSTTNGTKAIELAHFLTVPKILLASFLNARSVVENIKHLSSIIIICAGTQGKPTEEDILCAGYLVARLKKAFFQRQNAKFLQKNAPSFQNKPIFNLDSKVSDSALTAGTQKDCDRCHSDKRGFNDLNFSNSSFDEDYFCLNVQAETALLLWENTVRDIFPVSEQKFAAVPAVSDTKKSPSSNRMLDSSDSVRYIDFLNSADPQTIARQLGRRLEQSQGGKNLISIGLKNDIYDVARLDSVSVVPFFDPKSGFFVRQ